MFKYFFKKTIIAFLTFFGALVLVALLISFAPGSEGTFGERFLSQLMMVFKLDFGLTKWNKLPVSEVIFDRLGNTMFLAFGAICFNILVTLPLGILFAIHPGSRLTKVLSVFVTLVSSVPILVMGYVVIFYFSRQIGILPTYDQLESMHGFTKIFSIGLPMVILGLGDGMTSDLIRAFQETVSKIYSENYIMAVRARGASVFKHISKNTVIPIYTAIASKISYLLGGAIVVEYIFGWKGFGYQTWDAAWNQDYNVILAATMVFAGIVLVAELSKEILTTFVDPRVGE